MRISLLAVSAIALSVAACERPTDRVETRCLYGDLVYKTRDGSIGFIENSPQCAERGPPGDTDRTRQTHESYERVVPADDERDYAFPAGSTE